MKRTNMGAFRSIFEIDQNKERARVHARARSLNQNKTKFLGKNFVKLKNDEDFKESDMPWLVPAVFY